MSEEVKATDKPRRHILVTIAMMMPVRDGLQPAMRKLYEKAGEWFGVNGALASDAELRAAVNGLSEGLSVIRKKRVDYLAALPKKPAPELTAKQVNSRFD